MAWARSIAGTPFAGYCAARNITAHVEVIRPDQISQTDERVVNKQPLYRFVINFSSSKRA